MPGGAARLPMHLHQRTPYAVGMDRAPNPFAVPDWNADAFRYAEYDMDALPVRPLATTFSDFVAGDLSIRPESAGMAWFRIYREADADHDGDGVPAYDTIDHGPNHGIFVITCGAGGTLGFRDWDEVRSIYPDPSDRPFDRSSFETMRAQESIVWYRVAYSAAVSAGTFGNTMQVEHSFKDGNNDHHWQFKLLASNREADPAVDPSTSIAGYRRSLQLAMPRQQAGLAWVEWLYYGGTVTTNALGTIDWIMRLESQPLNW
jgi:hypothetical protein